jgi:DNA-binding NtrC family response regulator
LSHEPHAPVLHPRQPTVFVLEPDAYAASAVLRALAELGQPCAVARTVEEAVAGIRREGTGILLVNLEGRERDVGAMLRSIREGSSAAALIATATDVSAARVLEWVRAGASDVLLRPFSPTDLQAALGRAAQRFALESPSSVGATAPGGGDLGEVVGSDPRLAKALELARAASRVRSTVLIHGESGTGKSLLARAIHRASNRSAGAFVELACGSIPETLLESELFGHVKGAFTGAVADKKGRFLAANGGTLFLDEINSASASMQLKLLRVLQERKFEPVGSDETIEVDVRVIVASNQPLERLVDEGRFRQDLFYRVHVLPIELPPLRERPNDTVALAEHFLRNKTAELGRTILGWTPDAVELLRAYRWPGNVRELENAVERAVILCDGAWITSEHLPERVRSRAGRAVDGRAADEREMPREDEPDRGPFPLATPTTRAPDGASKTLADAMRDPERTALLAALTANGWNRSRAAASLGINRTTLYRKMRDLGLGPMRDAV